MSQAIKPTPEQEAIIGYDANLVAIARPGSGKTYVLSEKIRHALAQLKVYEGIIAISYTNKASEEIKRRVRLHGVDLHNSFFGTIDRFCDLEVILPFLPHIWGAPSQKPTITKIRDLPQDEQDQFSIIQPNQVSLKVLETHFTLIQSYYKRGNLFLEMNGALALFTIQNSLACRNYLSARYRQIFIDEYQDSGLEQHELFLELQKLGLIAVAVGDANQSIFGFSGKDSKYLTSLASLKEFKTFPLNFNHRCHPSIINYSLRLLDEDSELLPADDMHVYHARVQGTQQAVAHWLNEHLEVLCDRFDTVKLADVGILARNVTTAEIIDATMGLKHRYVRAHSLEEHSSIWGKLFATLLSYHFNDKTTAQQIIDQFGDSKLSGSELRECRRTIKILKQRELPRLEEFILVANMLYPSGRNDSAIELLDASLKDSHLDKWFDEPEDDEVQIMSLHKAKGLEFDIVFHLDLVEWVLPSKRPGDLPDGSADWNNCVYPSLDQDINLHYVGITRARKCCVLVSTTRRIASGGTERAGNPSEFLALPNLSTLRRPISDLIQ